MPPAALISLTASLTPLSKFVPDVAPVPDSSTNPTIRTGACCARDGSAAVIIQTAKEKQKTLFIELLHSATSVLGYLVSDRATAFMVLRRCPAIGCSSCHSSTK